MSIVTRFPPSPTGFMHIGTARTALFNWLYARHTGGKMLFRIEDTDRERYDPQHVQAIINGLNWLGIDWDGGPPLSQYEQRARHAEVAHALIAKGQAYYCYCSPEELDAMREKAKAEGRAQFYDRRWRDSKETPPAGVKPVVRIKAPLEGTRTVHDKVQGDVTVNAEQLDDMIILRSDGVPTYMLAVVVDDHDMGVTHVIRGDDHLNNTHRQNMVYEAMGWDIPVYAHLPLILGPDGAKLSKRHGATSVEEYRDMGYLPEAMRNYLTRLGWAHGDDEIFSTEQAIEWFDLPGIGQSAARFDFEKLNYINAHYIKEAASSRLLELMVPLFEKRGLTVSDIAKTRLLGMMDELKNRMKTLVQGVEETEFLVVAPTTFEDKAKANLDEAGKTILGVIAAALENLPSFDAASIEAACRSIAETHSGGKLGKVMMPFRAALTGKAVSPSVPHAAEVLGKDETLTRLKFGMAQ